MAHFAPCRDTDNAERMAELFVENVVKLHGVPLKVLTDKGTEFCKKFAEAVCKIVSTMHHRTTAYHPQSNGQTERMNRVLEDMLRHYVNNRQDNWDKLLPMLEFAVNNSYQSSVDNTPFFLNYGKHPRTPADLHLPSDVPAAQDYVVQLKDALDRAKTCMRAAQQRYKAYADQGRPDPQFAVGDKVLLNPENLSIRGLGTRKLHAKYVGPFEILEGIGPVAYRLALPEHMLCHNVFHVGLLKQWRTNGNYQPEPEPLFVDGEERYEVEEILDHHPRTRKQDSSTVKYLIKWAGYTSASNTWTWSADLSCPQALQEYWDGVAMQAAPGSKRGPAGRLGPVSRKRSRRQCVSLAPGWTSCCLSDQASSPVAYTVWVVHSNMLVRC